MSKSKNENSKEIGVKMNNFYSNDKERTAPLPTNDLYSIAKVQSNKRDSCKTSNMQHMRIFQFPTSESNSPNKKCDKYAVECKAKSRAGFKINNQRKENQDSFVIIKDFMNIPKCLLAIVCDGHGDEGQIISSYICRQLPGIICAEFDKKKAKPIAQLIEDAEIVSTAIKSSFFALNKSIEVTQIDAQLSGSTCCCLLITTSTIYCANVGDSRAILVSQTSVTPCACIALSKDHKPDEPFERKRIIQCKGRVKPISDCNGNHIGPCRIWLMDSGYPGLAMSRSIGDFVAKRVGVISDPEITATKIGQSHAFAVIGTDGVWDYMVNEKVAKMVMCNTSDPLEMICSKIVSEAAHCWKVNNTVVDDITVLLVKLDV